VDIEKEKLAKATEKMAKVDEAIAGLPG